MPCSTCNWTPSERITTNRNGSYPGFDSRGGSIINSNITPTHGPAIGDSWCAQSLSPTPNEGRLGGEGFQNHHQKLSEPDRYPKNSSELYTI